MSTDRFDESLFWAGSLLSQRNQGNQEKSENFKCGKVSENSWNVTSSCNEKEKKHLFRSAVLYKKLSINWISLFLENNIMKNAIKEKLRKHSLFIHCVK